MCPPPNLHVGAKEVQLRRSKTAAITLLVLTMCLAARVSVLAQDTKSANDEAGYIPIISGGGGYIHNVNGGVTTLEPQVNPVLVVPFGRHLLLESRTDFTGDFQRQNQTSGPFKGKVFKTVEYSQLDWLADSHVTVVGGRYLLPFGLFNERLAPVWVRNLMDPPQTAIIGILTTGAGDGLMLRGVAWQGPGMSAQYSAYFSVRSGINQFGAARTAGGDGSLFFSKPRLEVGSSYQRFLQDHRINNNAVYLSWQGFNGALDLKAEHDYSYTGHGYWIEAAYRLKSESAPKLLQGFQPVGRVQEIFPLHGGGIGIPSIQTERVDFGLNYYLRDNLRIVSSYGRIFSSRRNANIWNVGMTYRFTLPLWFGGSK